MSEEWAPGGAEEQWHLLLGCVTDHAIFLLDPQGRVASWNAGAERVFGYREGEALGLPLARFFTPEDVERGLHAKELEAAEAGRAGDDKWHVRKDGTRLWVGGVTTALRDQAGRLRGFAKVCRDLTEQRRRADEADAERGRKDEFLATLAHELRGPLAPIKNAVEVLRLQGPPDPTLRSARDIIDRQVQHLARLVDDLLDVARMTQGKVTLACEPVEVAPVVAHAVEACRPLVDARRQQLQVTLSPALRVQADPVRLTQVVGNLLTNAAKYTPEGGQIRLATEEADGQVVLRVRDDGIGIRPEVLPRVFELFTQAERALHYSQGGLGIGLTLVKSLVELHGGTVQAHSDGPGRGSEFVVRLPAADPPRTPARRVLVVDDNVDAAESLATFLRLQRHDVLTVHEGAGVLEAARAFCPEAILLDIGLPGGLTGYDLAPRLRELPGLKDALLVAVTGYGQAEDKRRAEAAGFDAHLTKPADLDALNALLASSRAGGEPPFPGPKKLLLASAVTAM